jgi:hypothetical protein
MQVTLAARSAQTDMKFMCVRAQHTLFNLHENLHAYVELSIIYTIRLYNTPMLVCNMF